MDLLEKIDRLLALYQKIDVQIAQMRRLSGIGCLYGCGHCCAHFEPYISLLEAIPLAEHVLAHREQFGTFLAQPLDAVAPPCFFYDPHRPLHCTIYPLRPLVCRLFAFSARRMPDGRLQYSACKAITAAQGQDIEKADARLSSQSYMPIYEEAFREVQAIDFHLATDIHPYSKSVKLAIVYHEDLWHNRYPEYADDPKVPSEANWKIPFRILLRDHLTSSTLTVAVEG